MMMMMMMMMIGVDTELKHTR